jgi:TrwC relaxase/AAA domain
VYVLWAWRSSLEACGAHAGAASLLGAQFAHHTARQTEGQAGAGLPPDPQLHSHVLLLGVAKRRDGRLVAIDSLVLHRGRGEAGAVYRAALAGRLSALGFEIERQTGHSGQYFEVGGISPRLREEWSSRHKEVESKGEAWRRAFHESFGRMPTPSEERDWAAKTRAAKAKWHCGDLYRRWHAQAAALGVTRQAAVEAAAQRRAHGSTLPPPAVGCARLVEELLSPEGVTREHATFDLARLRFEAYRRAPGLVVASDVERALRELTRHQDVIEVEQGVWTTREMLALESRVLAWRRARMVSATSAGVVNGAAWERALAQCPFTLSREQLAAVKVLRDSAAFSALVGEAGVGKGVVLRVAAEAWQADGRRSFQSERWARED